MPYPEPDKIRREFSMLVMTDGSIAIYGSIYDNCLAFFADDVIAPAIVDNLEALGEL